MFLHQTIEVHFSRWVQSLLFKICYTLKLNFKKSFYISHQSTFFNHKYLRVIYNKSNPWQSINNFWSLRTYCHHICSRWELKGRSQANPLLAIKACSEECQWWTRTMPWIIKTWGFCLISIYDYVIKFLRTNADRIWGSNKTTLNGG